MCVQLLCVFSLTFSQSSQGHKQPAIPQVCVCVCSYFVCVCAVSVRVCECV